MKRQKSIFCFLFKVQSVDREVRMEAPDPICIPDMDKPDTFMDWKINNENTKKITDNIKKLQKLINEKREQGKKISLVLTVGASNSRVNSTNLSSSIDTDSKKGTELKKQQNPTFKVLDDEHIVHVKIDAHPTEFSTSTNNEKNVTTVEINGAVPLSDHMQESNAVHELQLLLRDTVENIIQNGGNFIIRNFITDKFYPGLKILLLRAMTLKRKSQQPGSVDYINQYLEKDVTVNVFSIQGSMKGKVFAISSSRQGLSISNKDIL